MATLPDLLPPAAGEVGAAVGLEAYAFGFEQLPLPRPSGDGAACAVDDPVAGPVSYTHLTLPTTSRV